MLIFVILIRFYTFESVVHYYDNIDFRFNVFCVLLYKGACIAICGSTCMYWFASAQDII
jgi:hypothetical protein